MAALVQLIAALSLVILLARLLSRKRYPAPLPPGPPADPILGHARIFPRIDPQLTFLEWGKQYGQIALFTLSLITDTKLQAM